MENSEQFNFEEIFVKYKTPILILLIGLVLAALGIIYFNGNFFGQGTKIEILNATASAQILASEITVEIAGSIVKPGVYKLPMNSRVDDLLTASGGLSASADRIWIDKYVNRASKLTDGQKIFIPKQGEQTLGATAKTGVGDQTTSTSFSSDNNQLININTASAGELDNLPGIGPTYAQNIIEHRPYSTLEELVSKGAIKQSLLDKIKDKISVY